MRLRALSRRFALPLVVLGVLAVALAAAAGAYFSGLGSGSGTAKTITLGPPTGVTGPATTASPVAVSWTAPATAPTPTGYYVTRTSAGTTSAACSSSASSPITGTSCFDTGVANGTYTYTVTAVYHSFTAVSSPSGSVVVAAVQNKLGFTQNPQVTSPSGQSIGNVIVQLQNSGGTAVSTSGVSITLALVNNMTPGTGTLAGTLTQTTNSTGQATFGNLSVAIASTSYKLTASASGYSTGTSTNFAVTAGQASHLAVVSGSGQTAKAGVAFVNPLVVVVTDSAGNVISGNTVAWSAPSSGASVRFSNNNNQYNATSAANGQASVSVTANATTGTYTVTATGNGTNSVSFTLTND